MSDYNPNTLILEKNDDTYNYANGAFFGVCDTIASVQTKTVVINEIKEIKAGLSIRIKFVNAQEYNGQPKFKINSLTPINICRNGTTAAELYEWQAGEIVDMVYDGTNFIIQAGAVPSTEYYGGRIKLSSDINNISEAMAATPKAIKTLHDLINDNVSATELGFKTSNMYDAKGDGVSDDTAALQALLDSGAKTVFITDGTYLITSELVVPDDITVMCSGVIKKSGSFSTMIRAGNNNTIQVNIDNDDASTETVTDQTTADIRVANKSGVNLINCKILNSSSRYNIEVSKSRDVLIQGCFVKNWLEHAIGLRDGCKNIKIINNTVLYGHGDSENRYPIALNSSVNLTVNNGIFCIDNYIEENIPKWEGIDAHDLKNAVIHGNIIKNTLTGIAIVSNGQATENIIITDNIYVLTTETDESGACYGIEFAVAQGSKNCVIANNILRGCGRKSNADDVGGIKIYGADGLTVRDNKIETINGNGFYILSISTGNRLCGSIKIYGNEIDGKENGIYLRNLTDSSLIECDIYNNNIINCTKGITVTGTGLRYEYSGYIYCHDNTFKNCSSAEYDANDAYGAIISPGTSISDNCGRIGMQMLQNVSNGYYLSVCTQSSTNDTSAVWRAYPAFFCIKKSVTFSEGQAKLEDSRLLENTLGAVIVMAESIGYSASGWLIRESGKTKIQLWARKVSDGSYPSANIDLDIMVMLRP